MIPTFYFAIGFLIYIFFNVITFKTYSKKVGITKKFVLYMIFIYYSILAAYVINFVDFDGTNQLIVLIESITYVLAGGLFLKVFYSDIINKDESAN